MSGVWRLIILGVCQAFSVPLNHSPDNSTHSRGTVVCVRCEAKPNNTAAASRSYDQKLGYKSSFSVHVNKEQGNREGNVQFSSRSQILTRYTDII